MNNRLAVLKISNVIVAAERSSAKKVVARLKTAKLTLCSYINHIKYMSLLNFRMVNLLPIAFILLLTGQVFATSRTMSGTVYTDEGVTNIGSGKNMAISVNGGVATTFVTGANGVYSVAVNVTTNDKICVYLDNETEKATLVTIILDADLSGFNLYQNHLILRKETGGAGINNTDLSGADNGDADILYNVSGANLTVNAGVELYVWTGHTYASDGNINADAIKINGIFTNTTAGSIITCDDAGSITVNGTWTLTGGVGNLISLKSDLAGSQFDVINNGTVNLSYVDLKDCNASSSIIVTDGNDSGNNTYVIFQPAVYDGAVLTGDGAGSNSVSIDSISGVTTGVQILCFKISNPASTGNQAIKIDQFTIHLDGSSTAVITNIAEIALSGAVTSTVTTPVSNDITFGTPNVGFDGGILSVSNNTTSSDIVVKIKLKTTLTATETQFWKFNVDDDDVSESNLTSDMMGTTGVDIAGSSCALSIVATKLVWTTLPADTRIVDVSDEVVSGLVWQTQPVVKAVDANNNVDIDSVETVTLSLVGGAGTFAGTLTEGCVSGVANFVGNGIKYTVSGNNDGEGFVLRASGGALTTADTSGLSADVVATKLVWTTVPADSRRVDVSDEVVSGLAFETQPVVKPEDDDNKVDADSTQIVTLSLISGVGTFAGTLTKACVLGEANFSSNGVKYTVSGNNEGETFAIRASGGSLTAADTGLLSSDIVASQLVWTQSASHSGVPNGDIISGVVFNTQPKVETRDADNKLDTDYVSSVVLSETGAGFLSGTTSVAAVSGVVTYTGIAYNVNADQESFTLKADSGSLTQGSDTSKVADVVATKLSFTVQPQETGQAANTIVSGNVFDTQSQVEARNNSDKKDVNFIDTVTVVETGTGSLSGTSSVAAVAGVVTFTNLVYTAVVDNEMFKLSADDTPGGQEGNLTGTFESANTTANVLATKLVFDVQPSSSVVMNIDVVIHPVLKALDANNTIDVNNTDTLTISAVLSADLSPAPGILTITPSSGSNMISGSWTSTLLRHNTPNLIKIKVIGSTVVGPYYSNDINVLLDTTLPSSIMDLSASTGALEGEINLTWTAPGDE